MRLTLADGRQVTAAVALLLDYTLDEGSCVVADRLLEWLQKVERTGKATLLELEALTHGTGVRFVDSHHPESTYPNVYFFAPFSDRHGHLVLVTLPDEELR